MRLNGKVAIVTGACKGIGRAIAVGYAREGAAVVAGDRLCSECGRALLQEISAVGGKGTAVQVDVSNLAEHEKLITTAVQQFGGLDILVNNAGVELHESVLDAEPETWEQVISVNIRGAYFLSSRAASAMAASGGGKIINISSVHDFQPLRNRAIYSISKGGMMMMTKSLALELAENNICVNSISPGAILTDMNRKSLADPAKRERMISRIPLRRIGSPEDIVGAAVFLASSEADYVTGTTLYVDGGLLLR
jgi:glucose 1-dehydrogenase